MSTNTPEKLKVFICHSSADKSAARALYHQLVKDDFDAWLDEERLLPGQFWKEEIPKAVKDADAIIICLSNNSITKEGYVQKEIKFALDVADEKPEGTIFIIPARLEECNIPYRLGDRQWVNLFFERNSFNDKGYEKLVRALRLRSTTLQRTMTVSEKSSTTNDTAYSNALARDRWLFSASMILSLATLLLIPVFAVNFANLNNNDWNVPKWFATLAALGAGIIGTILLKRNNKKGIFAVIVFCVYVIFWIVLSAYFI